MATNSKARKLTKLHMGHELLYSHRWDAYWCVECNEWAEPNCSDAECEYCADRPDWPNLSIE